MKGYLVLGCALRWVIYRPPGLSCENRQQEPTRPVSVPKVKGMPHGITTDIGGSAVRRFRKRHVPRGIGPFGVSGRCQGRRQGLVEKVDVDEVIRESEGGGRAHQCEWSSGGAVRLDQASGYPTFLWVCLLLKGFCIGFYCFRWSRKLWRNRRTALSTLWANPAMHPSQSAVRVPQPHVPTRLTQLEA